MTQRSPDSARRLRAGGSRTAIVVAAVVLIAIGAVIVTLALGGSAGLSAVLAGASEP